MTFKGEILSLFSEFLILVQTVLKLRRRPFARKVKLRFLYRQNKKIYILRESASKKEQIVIHV